MTGKPFGSLAEGQLARWSHELTAEEVEAFIRLSGDSNPVHLDDAFARQHGFRGRVVHGALVNAFLSRVLGTVLPGPGVIWLRQEARFLQAVYVGERIEILVRIVHKSEALRTLVLETIVVNQRGETVLSGEASVMMLAQGQTVPLTEMVAIVTGSSRGIGAAVARKFGEQGVRVVVNYQKRRDAAEQVVSDVTARGTEAVAVQADVSTVEGAEALADAALKRFGRVDVLVNNATPSIARKPFLDLAWPEVDGYWNTYVQSAFTLTKRIVPGMKERGFGRIVHILTTATSGNPPPDLAGYVAGKSALWGLGKAMAVELAPFGITVNAVSPSAVMTDQWEEVPESRRRALAMRIPLRRLATPEEVAEAVLFLVDAQGRYVTGVNLPVAGGEVM